LGLLKLEQAKKVPTVQNNLFFLPNADFADLSKSKKAEKSCESDQKVVNAPLNQHESTSTFSLF